MGTVVFSFVACLLCFVLIGVASLRHSEASPDDYLVAGRSISGWLTALSSAATNNSGFMFVGLLGFTYRFGVQAIWLQGGWMLGDLLAWSWVHRAVRERSQRLDVISVPQFLATADDGYCARSVSVAAGAATFLFLGGYAAAQLKAGSAAFSGAFGWHPAIGIVLGAVIVVLYCFSGGLRASIWTDAAQALVMIGALLALLVYAALRAGGLAELFARLALLDPGLVQWIPERLGLGFPLYLLGFVAGGFGVVGQPHVLVRSMAIRSVDEIPAARRVYFLWYVPFSTAAVTAGLYARVLLPDLLRGVPEAQRAVAAEQTLPALANEVLPAALLGLLLAGVFAATMSTADSQILSCSAALTQDMAPRYRSSYWAGKLATLSVTVLATIVALTAHSDVFGLVLQAWSALGATLGPLLLVRLLRWPLPARRALVMMAVGFACQASWRQLGLSGHVFELLPGLLAPLVVYGLAELGRLRAPATRP